MTLEAHQFLEYDLPQHLIRKLQQYKQHQLVHLPPVISLSSCQVPSFEFDLPPSSPPTCSSKVNINLNFDSPKKQFVLLLDFSPSMFRFDL